MTYLYFTLLYLGLPLLVLGLTLPRPSGERAGGRPRIRVAVAAACMFVYTSGLSNYLAYRGVRAYEIDRALDRLFFIPLEEYVYLGAAALLVGLLLLHVLRRTSRSPKFSGTARRRMHIAGTLVYFTMMLFGTGLLLYGSDRVFYLAVLLVWASPVLILLWLFGGRYYLGEWRKAMLISAGVATIYLWITAWAGLSQYLWIISSRYTLSFGLPRFPLEEALLYLLFTLMTSKMLLLLLTRDRQAAPASE